MKTCYSNFLIVSSDYDEDNATPPVLFCFSRNIFWFL